MKCLRSNMDWNIRSNLKYLASLVVICGLIPHGMLFLLQIASTSDSWSPAEIEIYSNFFVSEWIPFWLAFISYLRLQKRDRFSLLPTICASIIVISLLPVYERRSVMTIALTIPLMLVVEFSALIKNMEFSKNKIFSKLSADRGLLRSFFFWSVVFECVVFISCEACTWPTTVTSPFLMLPIPGALLIDVFRQQKSMPPTLCSVIVMVVMVPISLYLVTIGPMEHFKMYHLMSLAIGYAILLLMLVVYNIEHWRRPKGNK